MTDEDRLIMVLALKYHIPPIDLVNYPKELIDKMAMYLAELEQERRYEEFKQRQKLKMQGLR